MTELEVLMFGASLVGALLFFSSGWFSASLRAARQRQCVETLRRENDLLRTRAEAARRRVEDLEGQLAAMPPASPAMIMPEAAPPQLLATDQPAAIGVKRTLERAMAELTGSAAVQAAVLADDLGFPVAGVGADLDALAAFTGFLVDVGEKARGILPVGEIRCVSVAAEHGVTVSVCPVQDAEVSLALATLAVGEGPTVDLLEDAAKRAFEIVMHRDVEGVRT